MCKVENREVPVRIPKDPAPPRALMGGGPVTGGAWQGGGEAGGGSSHAGTAHAPPREGGRPRGEAQPGLHGGPRPRRDVLQQLRAARPRAAGG